MGNKLPTRWMPGSDEPVYDDGVTNRLDFQNAKGLKLAAYEWAVPSGTNCRGAVVLVHGIDTHCRWDYLKHVHEDQFGATTYFKPRYEGSWIEELNKNGFVVYGLDMVSYGASEGHNGHLRGYFEEFQELVDDVIQFRTEVVPKHLPNPDTPVFLMGDSMGGCISTRVIEDQPTAFAGAILIAPMLSLEQLKKKPINTILLPVSEIVSNNYPTLEIAAKQRNTVYPEDEKAMRQDVLCNVNAIRARVAHECLVAVEKARAELTKIHTPTLVFHSLGDTMCDIEGSHYFVDHISSTDKTMVVLEDYMWHALVHEPGNAEVLDQAVAWMKQRV